MDLYVVLKRLGAILYPTTAVLGPLNRQQRLETEEDSNTQRKTWQVYCFGKRDVLRFDLKES